MERRGFLGTIMGAAAAVFAPIPVGENKLTQYVEPVKHTEDLFANYVGANCSGSVLRTAPTPGLACSGLLMPQSLLDDIHIDIRKQIIDEHERFFGKDY